MSDRGSDFGHKRDYRRRHSPGSEDDRKRKPRPERRQSFDRPQSGNRNGGRVRHDSRSDYRRRRYRSRSPCDLHRRENRERTSTSRSPTRRPRSSRDDRKLSKRDYSASRSPPPKRKRHDSRDDRRHSSYHAERRNSPPPRRHSPSPPPWKRSNAPLPSQQAAFKKDPPSDAVTKPPEDIEKQKPNYAPTGKLAAETNTVANTSIVLKYNEPPEARLPPASAAWRLYVFKGSDLLETLPVHERSCWLFGRERAVVDFPTEHPSCSKQHAVLQFRYTEKKDEWGQRKGGVKPYVIDLDSANGTKVNGEKVPERRYVEVRSGDVVVFGESSRLVDTFWTSSMDAVC